jgi:putative peptidoglycan lipid II flippase
MFSSPSEKTNRNSPNESLLPEDAMGLEVGLVRSAGVVSIGVMTSRVLGLVREMVLAYLFRAGAGLDAFYAAFRIPNLLRDTFGEGALSKAFVSTFTEVGEKEGDEAGVRLANQVLNGVVVIVGCLTLLGIYFADEIVGLMFFGEGFDVPLPEGEGFGFANKRELTVFLTRIMFPFLLLVSVSALVMGFLNARRKFFVPAMASSLFNIGSLVIGLAGYILAPRMGYHPTVGMAVGVVAGGVLQLLWQLPALFKERYRYRFTLSFRDPRVSKVVRLFGPGALAAATVQVNVFVNSIFASMGSGWLSWINQAFRLVHLPVGLIGVAVSVATLPALSRSTAVGDKDGFRHTFSYAIRLVILFTVPAMVGLIVLAVPIVRLIYERGQFQAHDSEQVAGALVFFALGLASYGLVKIVTDGFYAIQDLRAPLIVGFLSMLSNAGLNYLLVSVVGLDHRGLAFATSCTITLSFIVLWFLLRRRSGLKGLGGRSATIMLVKMIVASAVMGVSAGVVSRGVDACGFWMEVTCDLVGLGCFGRSFSCPRVGPTAK